MNSQRWWGYIFTMPFIIHILVLFLFPFFFSFYLTFTKWDLFNAPQWVGLKNWIDLLKEKTFWLSIRNIFYFALIFVPLQTAIALVFAYLLNQQIRGKIFFRTLYFLPVVTPWIAGGLVWFWLFNYQFGIINWLLSKMDLPAIHWLNSPKWWVVIGSVALVNVWKGVGYSMILLLAGMQGISKEMLEAAKMDGAAGWRLFKDIAIPIVSPMVYLVMIMATISAFHAFDVFYVMLASNGSIPDRVNIPNVLIYDHAFHNFKMGSASTAAWMLFLIIMAVTLLQKQMEKRWVHYE